MSTYRVKLSVSVALAPTVTVVNRGASVTVDFPEVVTTLVLVVVVVFVQDDTGNAE